MSLNKPKKEKGLVSRIVSIVFVTAVIIVNITIPSQTLAFSFDIMKILPNFRLNLAKAEEQMKDLPDSGPRKPDKVVNATITAYTSTKDQTDGDPSISASGKKVYNGIMAANWLPMGTKVKIPSLYGDKIFTVEDRMNPKHGGYGRMDIWLGTDRQEALKFGVKHVTVEVYYN